MTVDLPKVFVSYTHECDDHKAHVLAFATFLREVGIKAVLDLWSTDARQDWYSWAIREMTDADFVLVVASARYRVAGDGSGPYDQNRGVQSEASLLRELVYADRATWLPKVLPVLLPGHTIDQIPLFLQPHTASRFLVSSFDTTGTEELLRVILRQPGHIPPEVGTEHPVLPPRADGTDHTTPDQVPPARDRVSNQINGTSPAKSSKPTPSQATSTSDPDQRPRRVTNLARRALKAEVADGHKIRRPILAERGPTSTNMQ